MKWTAAVLSPGGIYIYTSGDQIGDAIERVAVDLQQKNFFIAFSLFTSLFRFITILEINYVLHDTLIMTKI